MAQTPTHAFFWTPCFLSKSRSDTLKCIEARPFLLRASMLALSQGPTSRQRRSLVYLPRTAQDHTQTLVNLHLERLERHSFPVDADVALAALLLR